MVRTVIVAIPAATTLWLGGCMPTSELFRAKSAFTGTITGTVVNTQGQPVSGIKVSGIYFSPFVHIIPPIGNQYQVGEAVTDAHGRFTLITSKKVEQLDAISRDFLTGGHLGAISQTGNTIPVRPRAE